MQGSSTGAHSCHCLGRQSTAVHGVFSSGQRNLQHKDALHYSSKGIASEGPLNRNLA